MVEASEVMRRGHGDKDQEVFGPLVHAQGTDPAPDAARRSVGHGRLGAGRVDGQKWGRCGLVRVQPAGDPALPLRVAMG